MKSFLKQLIVIVVIVFLVRLFREPYKWAQNRWELGWQQTGHLEYWWLLTVAYFVCEYLLVIGLPAMFVIRPRGREVRRALFSIVMDLAAVFFFFDLGSVLTLDPVLQPCLRTLHLSSSYLWMGALSLFWLGVMFARMKLLGSWPSLPELKQQSPKRDA